MSAVILARIQFAVTIGFHFLFPPVSIGLAWLLVIMEYLGWRRADPVWVSAGKFFGKLFALTFAVGVASGVVMEFQFGTNWATYSRFVGDIFGAPLAAEGVFAFFMESAFLGLYLFGRDKVSKRTHWISILMVAIGATISAFWIIVANSWQQTPAGFVMNYDANRAELADFAGALFNPSTLPRFAHTMMAALATGAFMVAGVSAWLVLKNRGVSVAQRTLKLAIGAGLATSLLVAFPTGDSHARQVAATQPEKFASIEGLVRTQTHAPLVVFGIPTPGARALSARIEVPEVLSLMAFGDTKAEVKGLDRYTDGDLPPMWLTFLSFHNMVALGGVMIALTAIAAFQLKRGRLLTSPRLLWALVIATPIPLIACQLGWITAEVGRQPWIVYRLLRTSNAVSVTVSPGMIALSLLLLGLICVLLGVAYLFLVFREIKNGPVLSEPKEVA